MTMTSVDVAEVLGELKNQGIVVTIHNEPNQTWYIKGDGIFQGYVATSDELIGLKQENRLNLDGIRSLG